MFHQFLGPLELHTNLVPRKTNPQHIYLNLILEHFNFETNNMNATIAKPLNYDVFVS